MVFADPVSEQCPCHVRARFVRAALAGGRPCLVRVWPEWHGIRTCLGHFQHGLRKVAGASRLPAVLRKVAGASRLPAVLRKVVGASRGDRSGRPTIFRTAKLRAIRVRPLFFAFYYRLQCLVAVTVCKSTPKRSYTKVQLAESSRRRHNLDTTRNNTAPTPKLARQRRSTAKRITKNKDEPFI
jgi:hypothetical protein